jgi:hypothetical protein
MGGPQQQSRRGTGAVPLSKSTSASTSGGGGGLSVIVTEGATAGGTAVTTRALRSDFTLGNAAMDRRSTRHIGRRASLTPPEVEDPSRAVFDAALEATAALERAALAEVEAAAAAVAATKAARAEVYERAGGRTVLADATDVSRTLEPWVL